MEFFCQSLFSVSLCFIPFYSILFQLMPLRLCFRICFPPPNCPGRRCALRAGVMWERWRASDILLAVVTRAQRFLSLLVPKRCTWPRPDALWDRYRGTCTPTTGDRRFRGGTARWSPSSCGEQRSSGGAGEARGGRGAGARGRRIPCYWPPSAEKSSVPVGRPRVGSCVVCMDVAG